MNDDDRPGAASVGDGDRLNSWKEIAAYLGKGLRTVERWEIELSLPVHRMQGKRGEIVFAFRSEIDKWQQGLEQAPGLAAPVNLRRDDSHGPAPRLRTNGLAANPTQNERPVPRASGQWRPDAGWAVVILLCVVVVGFIWRVSVWRQVRDSAPAVKATFAVPHHATVQAEQGLLTVFDDKGKKLWDYAFGFALDEGTYAGRGDGWAGPPVVLEDLDGDGRTEVVFRSAAARTAADCKLYCFGAGGGTPKFTYQPSRSVRYGNKDYNPPFPVTRFIVTTEAGKSKAIWVVAQHHLYFPTVVQKLNSTGGVLGEYWNDGHVRLLQEGLLGGRRVIFVGGTSSDHRDAATLSVLDYEHPGGSAPATDLRDRCIGCPEVAPMAFFLFPRLAVSRALKVKPYVTEIANSRPGGDFTVGVRQGDAPGNSQAFPGSAYYTFDSSLHLLRAETGDEYQHSHNRLYLGGFLPRPYGDADERELLRVLRWDGKTLAALR